MIGRVEIRLNDGRVVVGYLKDMQMSMDGYGVGELTVRVIDPKLIEIPIAEKKPKPHPILDVMPRVIQLEDE